MDTHSDVSSLTPEAVKAFRTSHNLTQSGLAKKAEMPRATLSFFELGKRKLSDKDAGALRAVMADFPVVSQNGGHNGGLNGKPDTPPVVSQNGGHNGGLNGKPDTPPVPVRIEDAFIDSIVNRVIDELIGMADDVVGRVVKETRIPSELLSGDTTFSEAVDILFSAEGHLEHEVAFTVLDGLGMLKVSD